MERRFFSLWVALFWFFSSTANAYDWNAATQPKKNSTIQPVQDSQQVKPPASAQSAQPSSNIDLRSVNSVNNVFKDTVDLGDGEEKPAEEKSSSAPSTGQEKSGTQAPLGTVETACALQGTEAVSGGGNLSANPDAGVKDNWRYSREAWQREYESKLQSAIAQQGGKPAKYYKGSPYSIGNIGTKRGSDVIRPDHVDITAQTGSNRTTSYAPALHNFENHGLGSYSASGNGEYFLYPDFHGGRQCNGSGCVVLKSKTAWEHLKTRFTATSSLKEVVFKYSLYSDGGAGGFSIDVINASGHKVISRFIANDNGCPANYGQGYRFCALSGKSFALTGLTNNQTYTLDFILAANDGYTHELSLDNIQFRNTAGQEYGGTHRRGKKGKQEA